MGFFSNIMESNIWTLLLLLLFVPTSIQEEGFASVLIHDKGLDFAKDLVIGKAISSMIPLQLPQVAKRVKVPLLGKVNVVLSNITLYSADVGSSYVTTGETGIVLIVSGATAKLSMNWKYTYNSWFVDVSDHGSASIEVQGMDVGLTVALENQAGTLNVSVSESGCYIRDMSIKMNGGVSWFYQGLVDAFEDIIQSSVEDAVSRNIKEGVTKLDSLLQTLPKEIVALHGIAAMNVTFVGDPVLRNSSIEVDINGLFMATNNLPSSFYDKGLVYPVAYGASNKMLKILLHENIFNSVSLVFFEAGYMHWRLDGAEDQLPLNTSRWKYIVPKLYKKYPNDAMELNISASSPPIIKILNDDIDATIYVDVTISVLDSSEVVPVACIALEITASFSLKIVGNNLVGTLELEDFSAFVKWSKIGNLHIHLIKFVMSFVLKRVLIPRVNSNLREGLPLPILHGFMLQNAEISCTYSELVISSDVAFVEQWHSVSRKFV